MDPTFHSPADFGYRQDNPGEDYCARKQRAAEEYAKEEHTGMTAYMLAGPVTAYMGIDKPMYMPASLVRHLPGANDEQHFRKPGDVKFDSLAASVRDNGWQQKHRIMIRVNHKGQAYLMEGNTRAALAHLHGVKDVLVQVEWVNGAENASDDTWSPQRVAALCTTEPQAFEPKAFWESVASKPQLRDFIDIVTDAQK